MMRCGHAMVITVVVSVMHDVIRGHMVGIAVPVAIMVSVMVMVRGAGVATSLLGLSGRYVAIAPSGLLAFVPSWRTRALSDMVAVVAVAVMVTIAVMVTVAH